MKTVPAANPSPTSLDDAALVERIAARDHEAFEALMRRYNGRLFRVARAILGDDAAAEDALQEAYLDAYRGMGQFRGAAGLATWLTRIVVNRALMLRRRARRDRVVLPFAGPGGDTEEDIDVADSRSEPPSETAWRGELRRILERRIDELPAGFRTVFMLREVDDLSVEETAECLAIPAATVRTRLFRARALLRESLTSEVDAATLDLFRFDGARCDRIVNAVLQRLRADEPSLPPSA